MRGPSPRVPGGQGARMGNNLVVSQQRQQQNQSVPQQAAQPLMYVAAQPFMQLNFGKFPPNYNAHTVGFPEKYLKKKHEETEYRNRLCCLIHLIHQYFTEWSIQ